MNILNLKQRTDLSKRLAILPIVNSSPVLDLSVLIGLIPVWWFLGIESLILPVGSALIAIKVLILRNWRIVFPTSAKYLSLFLLIYLASGLFIVESFRWITYFKNLSVILTIFFLHLSILNSVHSIDDVVYLLRIGVFSIGIAALFGCLAIIDVWRPSFTSSFGRLIPEWIANSSYGKTFVTRTFGQIGYYQIIGRYFRVKSLFTFSILYASALVYVIPVIIYLHQLARNFGERTLYKLIFALTLVNLIFTTGRTAIFSLILSSLFYLFFVLKKTSSVKILIIFISFAILIIFLVSLIQIEEIIKMSQSFADVLISGRGASTEQRLIVYRETIRSWLQRPVLGWGTERDIPDVKYPAGSHSFYLALLYRHGILGLFAFLMVFYTFWKSSRPIANHSIQFPELGVSNRFLEYGRWIFFAALLDAFTTDITIDILTVFFLWTVLSLLVVTRRLLIQFDQASV